MKLFGGACLASLVLIAACDVQPTGEQVKTDPRCATEIDSDPQVRELRADSAGSIGTYQLTHLRELADAKQDANLRCLRARGLVTGGGVERVKAPTGVPLF